MNMGKCIMRTLSQTLNGKIFRCLTCEMIHIEFKNLNFSFTEEEYHLFRDYFINLDPEKWEYKNRDTVYHRKVMVPIGHKNFTTMFHANEIHELKRLFKAAGRNYRPVSFINSEVFETPFSHN